MEFGEVETRKSKALEDLMVIEQSIEGRHMSLSKANQMINLRLEIQQLAKAEEISWMQKSRCLWLREEDNNKNSLTRLLPQTGETHAWTDLWWTM